MAKSKNNNKAQEYQTPPYKNSIDDLKRELETDPEVGLTKARANELKSQYGENKLSGEGGVKWYSVLLKQCSNAMILVLIFAMAVSFGIQDWIEGGVITAVIVLNIAIGFYQEFQAEKKMDGLRALSSPSATLLRDGQIDTIPSGDVVPGDVIIIKTGDTVPADIRLFESMNLECDEKILTGEAIPVAKEIDPIKEDAGVGDRINMAFSSTTVTKGRGRGIVVFTGMRTEIGIIAESMQGSTRKPNRTLSRNKEQSIGTLQPVKGVALRTWDSVGKFLGLTEGTPLQIKLSKLAYILFAFAIILAIIVFGANKFNVTPEVALYAISTGIAMIPESLIAVLTITFVTGMTQMRKKKVLTRKLTALEALGGITNICSDKTGTLTQGRMITRKVWVPSVGIYTLSHSDDANDPTQGSVTLGSFPRSAADHEKEKLARQEELDRSRSGAGLKFDVPDEVDARHRKRDVAVDNEKDVDADSSSDMEVTPEFDDFLHSASLCNLATVRFNEQEKKWQTTGDPTEVALQVFAHRFDKGKKQLESSGWKQLSEYPFDSSVKRMSCIYEHAEKNETYIFTKGATERVLDLCSDVAGMGPMTKEVKANIEEQMGFLADQGLRVLAIARRTWDSKNVKDVPREDVEKDLTLLGMAGLYDPPRLETKDAVRECFKAGIRVHMLTGDHPATATAIAKEVGITPRDPSVLPAEVAESIVQTASFFDSKTDEEIDNMPELPLVIARCAPSTKTRMIAALHRRKKYAAMTGDGVNDGPSLQAADVGIAMGLAGSDVAKGASDIVLTDDNFASIVNAIEEGRRMFDNIQKFVLHLLMTNIGEVVLLILGLAFRDDSELSVFPLSPLQILWINMLTSGPPAFGLGREKAAWNVMRRPPHDNRKGVFTWQVICDMMVYGMLMGILTLITFIIIVYGFGSGQLGTDCNKTYSDSCDVVFRARAAVFVELTWLILIAAWELKSLRRSMFSLDPYSTHRFPFFRDVYENKMLFWSVIAGFVIVFPCIYIPGFNTSVFKHKGISWEWVFPVVALLVFVVGVETYKLCKRSFGWFALEEEDDAPRRGLSLKQGFFTISRSNTLAKQSTRETSQGPPESGHQMV